LTRTPLECAEAHQRFLEISNTTAHQGLLKAPFASPIPWHVLGEVQGRLSPPQELERQFARALLPRTTHRHGCVTLHRDPCCVDQGWPQQQGLLGVSGQELRAVCAHGLFAASHCHDDLREGKVTAIRVGRFSPSPFASRQAQGARLARHPLESVVGYRPQSLMRQASLPFRAEQVWRFERVSIA
jgi:hypothetical protein